jgi:ABC-type dipeptide/oligopeptide/nickel transport system permease subunit
MDTTEKANSPDVADKLDLVATVGQGVMGSAAPVAAPEIEEHITISPLQAGVRRFMRDKRAVLFLAVILLIVIGSYVFPLIYTHIGPKEVGGLTGTEVFTPAQYHDPYHTNLADSDLSGSFLPLGPNSLVHPLGTDAIGRDIFARLMAGVNISIEVALMVEVFDIGLGMLLGTLAGWYGGWLGMALDRFTDIIFAFPGLLLLLLIGAAIGPIFDKVFTGGANVFGRMLMLSLGLGLLSWPLMMRYVRGRTLELKERQFIEAARVSGSSDVRILGRHIVPNLLDIVIVASTLNILATIVGEAGITILGAGLQPPASSLGLMIADATDKIVTYPTEMLWPVVILVVLVVSFSFVGDGVNDAFNPRSKD